MPFNTSAPISADNLSIRYFDALIDLPAASSVPLGTRAYVTAESTYYVVQPSPTAPHAGSWVADGPGSIGVANAVVPVLGGIRTPPKQVGDASYSVIDDDYLIEFNAALSAPRTITLPAPNLAAPGRMLIIKSANAVNGANVINTSLNIDGAAGSIAAPYGALRIYDSGTQWLSI